ASTARRIGLPIGPADFVHEVSTANGRTRAAVARIRELQLGKVVVNDVDTVVLDDAALSQTLIGMSFLSRLSKYAVEDGALLLAQ
ncbi:MAG: TIGR02281 family clan AA aspartic protease, partial [Rhizobiaceae bacterium]|nr:TIGR02281 family clan AA aspartic protease [Rhizobiaceae bacterium]